MKLPTLAGVIDRRILLNYRADAGVVARQLPAPLWPKQVDGYAMVGICLIRLRALRMAGMPEWAGLTSENAAHRIAVEWEEDGVTREGVYVRRRDTSSALSACAGGRLFPGEQHRARFTVQEEADRFYVALVSEDHEMALSVRARIADGFPADSVFRDLEAASEFFRRGAVGYSPGAAGKLESMELRCQTWDVEPLAVEDVRSSVYDDPALFPPGSIRFDNALLMRGMRHEWRSGADLRCPTTESASRLARSPARV
jgi:hypothetical protein